MPEILPYLLDSYRRGNIAWGDTLDKRSDALQSIFLNIRILFVVRSLHVLNSLSFRSSIHTVISSRNIKCTGKYCWKICYKVSFPGKDSRWDWLLEHVVFVGLLVSMSTSSPFPSPRFTFKSTSVQGSANNFKRHPITVARLSEPKSGHIRSSASFSPMSYRARSRRNTIRPHMICNQCPACGSF